MHIFQIQEQSIYMLRMARTDHVAALAELRSLQDTHPLSIIKLAEPIVTSTQNAISPSKRASDVSNSEIENPTPTSLEADLLHYKVPPLEILGKGAEEG
jgi:hypothetical protein